MRFRLLATLLRVVPQQNITTNYFFEEEMTDEETCVSPPACVKQEASGNAAIRPKTEFDELDNVFFIKEEEKPHLHSDSTNPTMLNKAARSNIKEEQEQADGIKSDSSNYDEEIKEEIEEIKYTESEVCDNIKSTIGCDGDNINLMQDSTNKQEGHNGKTRSKRRPLHTCPACQKTFSIYRYFEAHTDLCVNKNFSRQKKHECQECDYKTKRLCNLRRHMLSHSGERRYHCNECDYKAIHKAHLQVHIKYKHIKEKPYSCDLCDYKCTQYYMLNKHKIVHQEEKPFRCEVCGKEFKQKTCLDMHMYCHTKEQRPYRCGQCDFSAFTQSSLNTHVKHTHSGEKPFKCGVCDYKTVTATRLKRHMYKHGEEKPFKCEECPFQCVLRRKLQKHVSIKHVVKVETQ